MTKMTIKASNSPDYYSVEYEMPPPFNHWIRGSIYGIFYDEENDKVFYRSKSDSNEEYEEVNDDTMVICNFSFTSKGVWDGRLYFVEEELFEEQFADIFVIWNFVRQLFKEQIVSKNPGYDWKDDYQNRLKK